MAAAIAIGVARHHTSFQSFNFTMEKQLNTSQSNNLTEFSKQRRALNVYAGYVITVTGLSFLTELLAILVRWCNFGCVNLGINIFLTLVSVLHQESIILFFQYMCALDLKNVTGHNLELHLCSVSWWWWRCDPLLLLALLE